MPSMCSAPLPVLGAWGSLQGCKGRTEFGNRERLLNALFILYSLGAFNKALLDIKERFQSIILPLLYVKFPSSWVSLFKARKVFVGLTKGCTCCFSLNFHGGDPALITHFSSLPPTPYAQLALKWHFCGVWLSLWERWVFLLITVSGTISSNNSSKSNSRTSAGSFSQMLSFTAMSLSSLLSSLSALAVRLLLRFPLLLCCTGKCWIQKAKPGHPLILL